MGRSGPGPRHVRRGGARPLREHGAPAGDEPGFPRPARRRHFPAPRPRAAASAAIRSMEWRSRCSTIPSSSSTIRVRDTPNRPIDSRRSGARSRPIPSAAPRSSLRPRRRATNWRVLCFDWDVHHGNGTQDSFYGRSDLLFISTHQWPFYPGTGHESETGAAQGAGFTVNAPLPAGCGDGDYAAVFAEALLPIASAYQPELVLVSAGFDAHRADPLGGMSVTDEGFAALCGAVKAVADEHCRGRMVLTLEGGYDLDALARSVRACIEVLAGAAAPPLKPSARLAFDAVGRIRGAQKPRWAPARSI